MYFFVHLRRGDFVLPCSRGTSGAQGSDSVCPRNAHDHWVCQNEVKDLGLVLKLAGLADSSYEKPGSDNFVSGCARLLCDRPILWRSRHTRWRNHATEVLSIHPTERSAPARRQASRMVVERLGLLFPEPLVQLLLEASRRRRVATWKLDAGGVVPPTSLPAIFADSISGQSPEILGSRDRWAA